MGRRTAHVGGVASTEHGGDPSPSTARGVFVAIRHAVRHRTGQEDIRACVSPCRASGAWGLHLASLLRGAGAKCSARTSVPPTWRAPVAELGVRAVAVDEILTQDVGRVRTLCPRRRAQRGQYRALRAGIVAGAANNQLPVTTTQRCSWIAASSTARIS
jgi:leucine dehydrogenase